MRRSPDLIADHIVADTNRNQRVRVGSWLCKGVRYSLNHTHGRALSAIALWCFALTRLSLLEGKIGYFLEEMARRGA
jgi:hypothetical protein